MISYSYKKAFDLDEVKVSNWLRLVIESEGYELGEISYTFLGDMELLELNREYLNHDTLTDIISFDYTVGKLIQGDIFISVDRVVDNAALFNESVIIEMHRVIVHGVLHYCGYKDKTEPEQGLMRDKENTYLGLLSS